MSIISRQQRQSDLIAGEVISRYRPMAYLDLNGTPNDRLGSYDLSAAGAEYRDGVICGAIRQPGNSRFSASSSAFSGAEWSYLAGWIKILAVGTNQRCLFGCGNVQENTANISFTIGRFVTGGGNALAVQSVDSTAAARTPGIISNVNNLDDGKWHHIGGSFDGQTVQAYLDGEISGQSSYPATTTLSASGSIRNFGIGQASSAPDMDMLISDITFGSGSGGPGFSFAQMMKHLYLAGVNGVI